MEFTHTLKGNKKPNADGHILMQGCLNEDSVSNISFSERLTTKLMGTVKKSHRHKRTNKYRDIYTSIVNLVANLFP